REKPAGNVHVRAGSLQFACDDRQRLGPVDQDLDRVPRTWRRLAHSPSGRLAIERVLPAKPAKPPPVVATNLIRDPLAQRALDPPQQLSSARVDAAPRTQRQTQILR